MEQYIVEVSKRDALGSAANRRLRKQGLLPSVIYGHGQDTVSAYCSYHDFVKLAEVSKSSRIFTLKSTEKGLDGKSALVKQIQKDHLTGKLVHVDFQTFREDEDVTVNVPLVFKGEPVGVKIEGGVLTIFCHDITVSCRPRLIPETVEVDISNLGLNHRIHTSELPLKEGVKLIGNPEETVASVTVARAEEPAPTAAGAEAAPVEGGEAAAGAVAGTEAPAKDSAGKKSAE